MKVDSADIDKDTLIQILKDAYGLQPSSPLEFLPLGEESYCYILETVTQQKFFIKIQEPSPSMDIRFEAVNILHTQCNLDFIVCPHMTTQNTYFTDLGKYTVAIYNCVEDAKALGKGMNAEDLHKAAHLTALLHQSVKCPMLPSLPVETFDLWFEDWLRQVMTALEEPPLYDDVIAVKAHQLLHKEKKDILATLENLKQLATKIKTKPIDRVLTHGDLNRGNFIKDRMGDIHLVDWSKIAVGPPERDLVNYIGKDLELFISIYLKSFDALPNLHPELFEFYYLYLILWGIADYGSWILLENADITEKKFVWEQLQQLVPINHNQLKIEEIEELINRMNALDNITS